MDQRSTSYKEIRLGRFCIESRVLKLDTTIEVLYNFDNTC
jgi:hypothetical protein